mgnify:CR=1 FL=1
MFELPGGFRAGVLICYDCNLVENVRITALRGAEWYIFEGGRISEIRAYYASPADKGVPVNELVGFDYAGRGYHLGSR